MLEPILKPKELDMTMPELAARLGIGSEEIARALASYVRTIRSGDSPFDRYMNGDRPAVPPEARAGLHLFRGKAGCIACHVGPNFTDERFHNTGVAWRDGRLLDEGRFAVSGREADRGAFKTPTLREVARTAPYMHDGSLATIEDVIEFYNRGGTRNPQVDPDLRPLDLSPDEKRALAMFLRALSGTVYEGQ